MKECPTCKACLPDASKYCPQDGSATFSSLVGEQILDSRYQLERRLGQGSIGVVFRARHIFLKTTHAIKIILPDLVGNDPMLGTRFRQEALAATAIRHPNIIAVTDFGVVGGTMPFLVMEFVMGKTLQEIMSQKGAMPVARAFELTEAIARGLGAAHRKGLVHHDLKPQNIMLADNQLVAEGLKILDFGLARIKSGELLGSFINAQTAGLAGSPFYMAPEQWGDESTDRRTDVYSLGVMFYQILCGEVPFTGSSIPAVMKKHLTAEVPSFASHGVEVPSQIETAIRHALEKEPRDRTPSAEEFVSELREARAAVGPTLKSVGYSSERQVSRTTAPSMAGSVSSPSLVEDEEMRIAREAFGREAEARRREEEEEQRRREEERRRLQELVIRKAKLQEQLNHNAAATPLIVDREATQVDRTAESHIVDYPLPSWALAPQAEDKPIYVDENVQFTVYRPKKIKPQEWYTLLAYAHLSERRPDTDEPDPIEKMQAEVKRILGEQELKKYDPSTEPSSNAVPQGGEITFVPFMAGVEFNPPSQSFFWRESVHGQEFRMCAAAAMDGKTARGRMSVFLGAILLAELNLTVQVNSVQALKPDEVKPEPGPPVHPYRNIFPSYSHEDIEIVAQLEEYAQLTGDKYMRDVNNLRSGQNWKEWMRWSIAQADIFQLFWSTNSMRSENVRLEWEQALSLQRSNFIRPTYWEQPMPKSPAENLPPPELKDLYFQPIRPLVRTDSAPQQRMAPSRGAVESASPSVSSRGNSASRESPPSPAFREPNLGRTSLDGIGRSRFDVQRRCPTCNRIYTDASLRFCLEDGMRLLDEAIPSDKSVKLSSSGPLVPRLSLPVPQASLPVPQASLPVPQASASYAPFRPPPPPVEMTLPHKRSRAPIVIGILFLAILALVILGVVIVMVFNQTR